MVRGHLLRVAFPLSLACACGLHPAGTGPDSGAFSMDENILGDVTVRPDQDPPQWLSETNLVAWNGQRVIVHPDAFVYEINAPLFSDYAIKERSIWIPDGKTASWTEQGVLDFPVGTVLTKTFLYAPDLRQPNTDRQIIETRLLIRNSDGWSGWPYVWDSEGQDAQLDVTGDVQVITFLDPYGAERTANYLVPQQNQCISCHESRHQDGEKEIIPLGPTARQLHRPAQVNGETQSQLQMLADLDMLEGLPALETVETMTDTHAVLAQIESEGVESIDPNMRDLAARDYLDGNCAHCHNPNAVEGLSSQLWLNHDNDEPFHFGVCKRPTSAGEGTLDRDYDIVPGDAYNSVLWYRLHTEELGAMMPQIGRSVTHDSGSDLVAAWIDNLPPAVCNDTTD